MDQNRRVNQEILCGTNDPMAMPLARIEYAVSD